MKLFPLRKELLWKEWRQNRWLFWTGLIFVSFSPIVASMLKFLEDLIVGGHAVGVANYLDFYLHSPGGITFFVLATLAAVILGSVLLAQERSFSNPLEFLASTPVSRREVLVAKFVIGLSMIWMVLAINLAFILLTGLQLPHIPAVMWWAAICRFLVQGLGVTAVYSMSFCVSTLFGNLFSSLIGCVVVVLAPPWLLQAVNGFWGIRISLYDMSWQLPMFYLPSYAINTRMMMMIVPWFLIPLLVMLIIGFYALAVALFERSHFENHGRVLMFGDFWKALAWIGPLFFAMAVSAQFPNQITSCLIFLLVFVPSLCVLLLVQRIRASLGFR